MGKHAIEVGDAFVKYDDLETVWIVQRFIDRPGLPRHAELKTDGYLNCGAVVSVSALLDQRFFRRLNSCPPWDVSGPALTSIVRRVGQISNGSGVWFRNRERSNAVQTGVRTNRRRRS